jgi:hypothetical protein
MENILGFRLMPPEKSAVDFFVVEVYPCQAACWLCQHSSTDQAFDYHGRLGEYYLLIPTFTLDLQELTFWHFLHNYH